MGHAFGAYMWGLPVSTLRRRWKVPFFISVVTRVSRLLKYNQIASCNREATLTILRGIPMQYLVTWTIECDADSPKQAAEEALEIQRDSYSEATYFEVTGPYESDPVQVHLK